MRARESTRYSLMSQVSLAIYEAYFDGWFLPNSPRKELELFKNEKNEIKKIKPFNGIRNLNGLVSKLMHWQLLHEILSMETGILMIYV